MTTNRLVPALIAACVCTWLPATAVGSTTGTVAPTSTQRSAILKAFGEPRAGWRCMSVRLAASDRNYASVRPLRPTSCLRWEFNRLNVLKRTSDNRWKVLFEGSAYACPLARIPRQVQRDLGVCR
jgi:hypothetical protein